MIKTKRPGIDVAVVLFFKRSTIPSKIRIREFSMSLANKIPGFITGLSGQHGLAGMMFARKYADERDLEMVVVDLFVEVDRPLYPKVLKPEDLPEVDLLNIVRSNKDMITRMGTLWQSWIEEEHKGIAASYDWTKPGDFLARRPDLLPRLLKQPDFKHVNVVTHPVMTSFHLNPLTATSFPSNYGKIMSASARFHPDIEVIL